MAQQAQPAQQAAAIGPGATEMATEAALVKASASAEELTNFPADAAVLRIPIEVDVAVPNFRVRNLLALDKGHVIESLWMQGEDLPLAARDSQLAWSEFEVIDQKLAVRITRLI